MRDVLGWLSWWGIMGGFLLAAWWLAAGEAPTPGMVGGLTIANSVAIVVIEQLLPRKRTANLLRDRQSLNDMAHGAMFHYGGRPLAQAVGATTLTWLAGVRGAGELWPTAWPLAAQVALGVFLWSATNYWYHRALHTFTPMWWFHALHHDARQMHLLKSGRQHVVEEFFEYLLVPIPFLMMGVGAEVMAWVALWLVSAGNLAHSNVDQRFPYFAHYLLPTIQNHYLHHAEARRLQDSNYASLPFLDVLFGTYHHPVEHPVAATGIEGDPVPAGLLAQVTYPFRALVEDTRAPSPAPHE